MSQTTDNILYIPIKINGGTKVPTDLLERELFIKNCELYVGNGTTTPDMIIGRVVPGATITDATLKGKLKLHSSLIKTPSTLPTSGVDEGQVFFVDEGQY